MRTFFSFVTVVLVAATASAQSSSGLSRAFEGKTIVVKIDMPATSDGVEVRPTAAAPVDFHRLASLIKADGIGVHRGESIMVTKVMVKDHHIEFQLGGGGYGTFGDVLAQGLNSAPTVPYEGKSHRQKDLESDLRYTYDPYDRADLKREIRDEDRARNRDNTLAAVVNAQAQAANEATVRAQRAQSGSRFNIRYDDGFPEGALTPGGLIRALSQYADFGPVEGAYRYDSPSPAADSGAAGGLQALRKGLTVLQVEQILGPAAHVTSRTDGSIEMTIRDYTADRDQVSAKFVGGVLVDYTITPRR